MRYTTGNEREYIRRRADHLRLFRTAGIAIMAAAVAFPKFKEAMEAYTSSNGDPLVVAQLTLEGAVIVLIGCWVLATLLETDNLTRWLDSGVYVLPSANREALLVTGLCVNLALLVTFSDSLYHFALCYLVYKVIDFCGAVYTLNQVIEMIRKSRERLADLRTAPRVKPRQSDELSRAELLAELRRVIRNEEQQAHTEAELAALQSIVDSMARFYRRPWQLVRQSVSFVVAMVLIAIVLLNPGADPRTQIPLYYAFAGLIIGSELIMFVYRIIMDDALLKGEKQLAEATEQSRAAL